MQILTVRRGADDRTSLADGGTDGERAVRGFTRWNATDPQTRPRDRLVEARAEPGAEPPSLTDAAAALAAERSRRGVVVTAWADGRQVPQPFPQDPWPRVVPVAEWQRIVRQCEVGALRQPAFAQRYAALAAPYRQGAGGDAIGRFPD